jgi:cell wall-associated NlpC family hydrolase
MVSSVLRTVSLGFVALPLLACSGPPRYVAGGLAPAQTAHEARPELRDDPAAHSKEAQLWRQVYAGLLGAPYRYGGTTPRGFDCSGLVGYAYRAFDGRRLPRTVAALFAYGRPVKTRDLRVGDLVFYTVHGRAPSHVGIYLGGERFLHASRKIGVTVSHLDEAYYARRFVGARRLTR